MTDDPASKYPLRKDAFIERRSSYDDVDRARLRLAEATRRIIDEQATTVASEAAIQRATELVAEAAAHLAAREHGRPYEGTAEGSLTATPFSDADRRAFIDFSPFVGAMSPLAPPIEMEWEADTVIGRVTYGLPYEGPPGCLHGGFVAAGFDEVLGYAQSLSGQPGMTGRLTVSYRSPTPLFCEVVYRARYLRSEGRKVFTEATLHADHTLCAEAEGLFIAARPEVFERLFAARHIPESRRPESRHPESDVQNLDIRER